jgi:hypothetical protein
MDALTQYPETHGLPSILVSFELADDHLRAPNEKYNLTSFPGGTKSRAGPHEELAKDA